MLTNAAAAAAASLARGATSLAIERALGGFAGVKDRDERVAVFGGITFVNDTAATAPAAAVAALRRYRHTPVHWIAGGSDKRLDLTPLVEIAPSAHRVYLLSGAGTDRLRALFDARGIAYEGPFDSMEGAVTAAAREAGPGSTVLLSPGCASFGMFRDEFERGEHFRQAVRALEPVGSSR
jgi:UDP-N-acetylmuramoylalanine--D-glutamate ligase